MIGKLTGILLEKNPPQILVDCNGVGYEVDVPMTTFYNVKMRKSCMVFKLRQSAARFACSSKFLVLVLVPHLVC